MTTTHWLELALYLLLALLVWHTENDCELE